MVRIRKKTTNRATTAHRAKVKHKARETKKKNKKDMKKNPHLHRPKKKRDPGIPNSFPFKEQVLADVAESRRRAIEEKRSKESKRSDLAVNSQSRTSENIQAGGNSLEEAIAVTTGRTSVDEHEAPLLIDTTIPNTDAALQVADVVISVLDARDPLSYRSTYVEGTLGNTPLLYVLNKIDLAPREAMSSWLAHLRQIHPTFLFRSASAYLPVDPHATPAKSKAKLSNTDAFGRDVLLEALHAIAEAKKLPELTIAIVGITNVGKSAFISSLVGQSSLAIYSPLAARDAAPSTTPHPQSVNLFHKKRIFKLIDTPGLSFIPPSEPAATDDSEVRVAKDILLRNRGNISKIRDPLPAALYILSRAIMEDMIMLYNLPAVQSGDYDGFLTSLARKEGAVQRKGAVDFQGAARALVRDWKTGRFAYYTLPPPPPPSTSNVSTRTILNFPTLLSIFERSDQRILSQVQPRRELRKTKNGLVQLRGATADERRVDLEATVDLVDGDSDEDDDISLEREGHVGDMDSDGEHDEGEEGDSPANDEEDGSDRGETGSEQSSEEDEDDIEVDTELDAEEEKPAPPSVPLKLSGKRGREVLRVERGSGKQPSASKKGVSFAPYTKAGMKLKATTPRKPIPVSSTTKRASNLPSLRKSRSKGVEARESRVQEDEDAYDFSKYF